MSGPATLADLRPGEFFRFAQATRGHVGAWNISGRHAGLSLGVWPYALCRYAKYCTGGWCCRVPWGGSYVKWYCFAGHAPVVRDRPCKECHDLADARLPPAECCSLPGGVLQVAG